MKNEDINKKKVKKNTSNKESKKVKVEAIEEVVEENTSIDEVNIVKDVNGKKNKGDLFLALGLALVVILGLIVMRDVNAGPNYELPLTLSGEAGLHQLSYSEYLDKVNNGDEFVLIIERASCSHCVTYLPIAEDFASSNNLPMYYVDTDTFTSEDWETFEKSNTYLKRAKGNWGTPTTLVLAGREYVSYIEGTTNHESLLKLYQDYFDIKLEEE